MTQSVVHEVPEFLINEKYSGEEIGKFDDLPRVSRLYDNGVVRIYRMGGL